MPEPTEEDRVAEAVTQGYPDVVEKCARCGVSFRNYEHFIRCGLVPCPMSDGKGLILDRLLAWLEALQ